ncbi:MAG: hypothetical protein JXA30_22270 [Deltaproteobacteria bacterium]|nr:hypothetical protein [Deltaproteobacteria bacterium]
MSDQKDITINASVHSQMWGENPNSDVLEEAERNLIEANSPAGRRLAIVIAESKRPGLQIPITVHAQIVCSLARAAIMIGEDPDDEARQIVDLVEQMCSENDTAKVSIPELPDGISRPVRKAVDLALRFVFTPYKTPEEAYLLVSELLRAIRHSALRTNSNPEVNINRCAYEAYGRLFMRPACNKPG